MLSLIVVSKLKKAFSSHCDRKQNEKRSPCTEAFVQFFAVIVVSIQDRS